MWADGFWADGFWADGFWATAVAGPSAPTIAINGPAEVNVVIGRTLQLSASTTGEPAPSVAWASSNELVATVDANGLVTGVGAGSAVITATATNASGSANDTVTTNVRVASPVTGSAGPRVSISIGI